MLGFLSRCAFRYKLSNGVVLQRLSDQSEKFLGVWQCLQSWYCWRVCSQKWNLPFLNIVLVIMRWQKHNILYCVKFKIILWDIFFPAGRSCFDVAQWVELKVSQVIWYRRFISSRPSRYSPGRRRKARGGVPNPLAGSGGKSGIWSNPVMVSISKYYEIGGWKEYADSCVVYFVNNNNHYYSYDNLTWILYFRVLFDSLANVFFQNLDMFAVLFFASF